MTSVPGVPQSPSAPRSIISRIASPFTTRARNVRSAFDFHIETDEPHRQYSPGDVVRGSVVLTVNKPTRISHLVICLHGFAKVFRNAIAPGDGISRDSAYLGTGRGKRGSEYFGNGFVSLFEDEVVLCGDGKLNIGLYAFKFEIELPPSNIPSSIDFERGTISYLLTSTLTRPGTLATTTTRERKLYLTETVDIATLRQPKPRVITLEPIGRRSKAKAKAKAKVKNQASSRNINTSINDGGAASGERPQSFDSEVVRISGDQSHSPAPSVISSVSAVSSSKLSSRTGNGLPFSESGRANEDRSSTTSTGDGTITATAELVRGGCLPGDLLPVKISIDHNKPVTSVQGIIITLYRLGRIDMHPGIPLGPSQKGKKPEYEDYYPKSRTGLGGLSLSSAGSSHVFRMDLAQSFAPLIIDPTTLTAVINASVRVPDDVFPSITCVPGGMISFSYFVEVVMDLRGKLAGQDRLLPRLGMTGTTSTYGHEDLPNWTARDTQRVTQLYTQNFVDTDEIRREKSVVACLFEIVVGTRDSARKATKKNGDAENVSSGEWQSNNLTCEPIEYIDQQSGEHDHEYISCGQDQDELDEAADLGLQSPILNLPIEPEEELDEKQQIRRAEERLLPSAPPLETAGSSSMTLRDIPSAPSSSALYIDNPQLYEPSAPAYPGPSLPSIETIVSSGTSTNAAGINGADNPIESMRLGAPTIDKQERERQWLLEKASSPSDYVDEEGIDESSRELRDHARQMYPLPSAPFLDEDGGGGPGYSQDILGESSSRYSFNGDERESLPRYQK